MPLTSRFRTSLLVASCALLFSCNSADGVAGAPIIGGTHDTGDPAVVMLAAYPPSHSSLDTCTAVVISPTVLLTAAHCVDEANHPGYQYGVFLGDNANIYPSLSSLLPHLLAVSEVHAHPDYDPDPPFHGDIAVVIMAQPLTIDPLPIQREPLTADIVGQPARIVGYGQIVAGNYNTSKQVATTVVSSLPPADTVVVGDSTHRSCVGDSGGPALVEMSGVETVIGVDSYSQTSGCVDPADYQRTDVYLAFIDTYVPPEEGGGGAGPGSSSASTAASTVAATTAAATSAQSTVAATSGASGVGGGGSDDADDGGCTVAIASESTPSVWLSLMAAAAVATHSARRASRSKRKSTRRSGS